MRHPTDRLWTIPFVLVTLATTVVFFGLYFLVLAVPSFAASIGATPSQIGVIVAVPSLAAAGARLLVTNVTRRRGQKGFLMAGLVLFGLSAIAHGLARTQPVLLAARSVLGVGWGWTTTALGTLVTELTPSFRRGEAIGIWGLAPTIAMAAGPAAGGWLLELGGYDAVFAIAGGLGLLAAILVAPVSEPRTPAVVSDPAPGSSRLPRGSRLPSGVAFLASLSYGAVIAFLPLHLADDPGRLGAWFSLYAATILIARPTLGRLSDKVGRLAVVHPSLAIGACGIALLAAPHRPAALWGAAILYGVGMGGGAFPGLMALTVDRCPPGDRGSALAVFFTAYDLSIAAGAAMLGPVYAAGGLTAVSLTAAALIAVSQILLALGARVRRPSAEAA